MKKSTHVAAFVGAGLGALVGTYFGVKALVACFITFGLDLANLIVDKPEKCADDKQMPKSDNDSACNSCDSEKQDNAVKVMDSEESDEDADSVQGGSEEPIIAEESSDTIWKNDDTDDEDDGLSDEDVKQIFREG